MRHQAEWEASGLRLVNVVPILKKQLPEAAGHKVKVELRGQEQRSETPPHLPMAGPRGPGLPPHPLGHKIIKADSSFTPGKSCKVHLPVPTKRNIPAQGPVKARRGQAGESGYQRAWSLYRPWVPRAVARHVETRGVSKSYETQDSVSEAILPFTGLVNWSQSCPCLSLSFPFLQTLVSTGPSSTGCGEVGPCRKPRTKPDPGHGCLMWYSR